MVLPIFTTYLTPVDYGVIGVLAFISFLIAPLFGLGLGISCGIAYYEKDSETRKDQTIWTTFVLLGFSSVILLLVTMIFSKELSVLFFKSTTYNNFIILSVLTSIFNSILIQPFTLKLQLDNKAKLYVVLFVIANVVTLILNLFFVIILKRGVWGWVESGLISGLITLVLFAIPTLKYTKFAVTYDLAKELIKLGLPLVPSFFFLFVIQHSSRYMLERYHDLQAVGIFTIGYNFGLAINLGVGSFTTAWYPYFTSFMNKQEETKFIFNRILTYYTYGFGTLVIMFFLFAKTALILLTQPQFYTAYTVVGFIALSQFFIGVFSLLVPGIYFNKETKYVNYVQVLSCIVVLLLNWLLIPRFAVIGAALATVGGVGSMAFFQYLLNNYRPYVKIEYEWIRLLKFAGLLILAAAYAFYIARYSWKLNLALSLSGFIITLCIVWTFLTAAEKTLLINKLHIGVKINV